MTKLILSAAVAGAIAFGATTSALAFTTNYPVATISLSGTVYYSPNYDGELSQQVPLKKVSYNNKTLIDLLNASSSASNIIFQVTTKTNIPSGSYFLFSPGDSQLYITNKNGFFFPLQSASYNYEGPPFTATNYLFGYLYVDAYQLVGTYNTSSTDYSGSETDKTGIYFYFENYANNNTYFELYGTGTLNWTYGKNSGLFHKTSLSLSMSGISEDESEVASYYGVHAGFSASGSGSEANQLISTNIVPFFYNFNSAF